MTPGVAIWLQAFAAGAAFGAIYFLLLWRAARSLTAGARDGSLRLLYFCLQTILRIGALCAGLYAAIAMGPGIVEIGLAGVGFAVARLTIITLVQRQDREGG